jgi:hypothetical protein
MEYFVDIKLRSRRHLTKRMLLAIAQIGGVATGKIGGRRLETTLTVTADDARCAEACVLSFIRRRLPSEFDVIEARAVAAADVRAHHLGSQLQLRS